MNSSPFPLTPHQIEKHLASIFTHTGCGRLIDHLGITFKGQSLEYRVWIARQIFEYIRRWDQQDMRVEFKAVIDALLSDEGCYTHAMHIFFAAFDHDHHTDICTTEPRIYKESVRFDDFNSDHPHRKLRDIPNGLLPVLALEQVLNSYTGDKQGLRVHFDHETQRYPILDRTHLLESSSILYDTEKYLKAVGIVNVSTINRCRSPRIKYKLLNWNVCKRGHFSDYFERAKVDYDAGFIDQAVRWLLMGRHHAYREPKYDIDVFLNARNKHVLLLVACHRLIFEALMSVIDVSCTLDIIVPDILYDKWAVYRVRNAQHHRVVTSSENTSFAGESYQLIFAALNNENENNKNLIDLAGKLGFDKIHEIYCSCLAHIHLIGMNRTK